MSERHFYDSDYWRGDGRSLLNLRRMHALLMHFTEQEPGLQAPYFLPVIHQYKRKHWLGWEATWWASDGGYLHLNIMGDWLTLEIGHMDEDDEMTSAEVYRFSDHPPAGSHTVYEPYSKAGLDALILRAQSWLRENRSLLQDLDYNLNRLFSDAPAATRWEAQQDEDWADHISNPSLTAIRRLLCLMQAAHRPGVEPGFLTFMGYSEDDHDLKELHQISCEWFYTEGYEGPCASIEIHADGSILWDGFSRRQSTGERETIFELEYDVDDEASSGNPLTLDRLNAAITGQEAWLMENESHRQPLHRLHHLFMLEPRWDEHRFDPELGAVVSTER